MNRCVEYLLKDYIVLGFHLYLSFLFLSGKALYQYCYLRMIKLTENLYFHHVFSKHNLIRDHRV